MLKVSLSAQGSLCKVELLLSVPYLHIALSAWVNIRQKAPTLWQLHRAHKTLAAPAPTSPSGTALGRKESDLWPEHSCLWGTDGGTWLCSSKTLSAQPSHCTFIARLNFWLICRNITYLFSLATQPERPDFMHWEEGTIPCTDSESQCLSSCSSSFWLCTWGWCTPTAPATRMVTAWQPAQEEVKPFTGAQSWGDAVDKPGRRVVW